ncbi:MAG: hypothetical protein LBR33_03990 [Propionibacteriaceae bacterium]|nr:hypothetical protein [Propionibacteriaceae bacterium]
MRDGAHDRASVSAPEPTVVLPASLTAPPPDRRRGAAGKGGVVLRYCEIALCLAMFAGVFFTVTWPRMIVAVGGPDDGAGTSYVTVIAAALTGLGEAGPTGWSILHGAVAGLSILGAGMAWAVAAAHLGVRGWARGLTRLAFVLTGLAFASGFALTTLWRWDVPWLGALFGGSAEGVEGVEGVGGGGLAGLSFDFLAWPFLLFTSGYVLVVATQWARRPDPWPFSWGAGVQMMMAVLVASSWTVLMAGVGLAREPLAPGAPEPAVASGEPVLTALIRWWREPGVSAGAVWGFAVVAVTVVLAGFTAVTLGRSRRGVIGWTGIAAAVTALVGDGVLVGVAAALNGARVGSVETWLTPVHPATTWSIGLATQAAGLILVTLVYGHLAKRRATPTPAGAALLSE